MRPLITLTSDFGPGDAGCGAMEGVIHGICPEARVVHFCHAIPGFDIKDGARQMEGLARLPVGFHVGVVDPGVGTERKGVALQTGRGDVLIGPDNGLFRPAAVLLGGIRAAFELKNEKYRNRPVSPIFHGRDIFAPAAGWLAQGLSPRELGPELPVERLSPSPFGEARWEGGYLRCEVLHINRNGSLFLNVRGEVFREKLRRGDKTCVTVGGKDLEMLVGRTFGDAAVGEPLLLEDDFGRVEVAVARGNFAACHNVRRGDCLTIRAE